MDPARWKQVESICQAALERAPPDRDAFLAAACAGDAELRREVESLLEYESAARDFIEGDAAEELAGPGSATRADGRSIERMVGETISHYHVVEKIGEGGMGEVYRARDPRLDRDVAIKVLPEGLAQESDRLRRFQREARAAGALNHPNVLSVHDVGTHEGHPYVVTELLEGQTLRECIGEAALPVRKAVEYAIQVAHGLAAAHEKGIVHRDLKPENVFLTEDGRAKILDFGLAKLTRPTPLFEQADRTVTDAPSTASGVVVGTVGYMSPEQVRGEEVDPRSDIFSFGAVLHEMLSGRRAFRGGSRAETLSAILKEDPAELSGPGSGISPGLAGVVRRCLEKRPGDRFHSAHDLALALEVVPSGVSRLRLSRLAVVAASGLVAGVLGWWLLSNRAASPPREPIEITRFTADGGRKERPQLSPDGEKVAYAWTGPADDNWDIYVKALGVGTSPLRLTEDPGSSDSSPVWSPDGRRLAFVREFDEAAALYTVPSLGGQERKLIDVSGPTRIWESFVIPSWSPDGKWLAFAERPSEDEPARIVRLSLDTLEKEPLTSPPGSGQDLHPVYSPDGTRLAFVRSSARVGASDIWVQPAEGGEPWRLTFGEYRRCRGLAWTTDGREILFYTLWSPRDRTTFRVSLEGGGPQPIAGIGNDAVGFSIRGERMVYRQVEPHRHDTWRVPARRGATRDRAPKKLIVSSGNDDVQAYSPDGQRISFMSSRSGVPNIWVCDSDGSNPVQLTSFESMAGTPNWSPDGRRLVFDSAEAGDYNLYVIDADGGVSRRLTRHPSADHVGSWSRDGRWIYFASERSGRWQTWKVPAEGGEAVQVTRGGGHYAEESWDGRYVYYVRSLRGSIWRVPVEEGDETEVVSGPIFWSNWALSRSGLYYATQRWPPGAKYRIRYLDLESGQVSELFRKDGPFFYSRLAVSPGEEWILFTACPFRESELMLVENFR